MDNVGKKFKAIMATGNYAENYRKLMDEVYADPEVENFIESNRDALTDESVKKSASSLYEFVNKRDAMLNGKDTYAHGYEPKLVVNNHAIEVSYQPTQAYLTKVWERQIRDNIQDLGMSKALQNANINDYYHEGNPARENALVHALDFIDAYENNPQEYHKGFYIYGSFGVGKSYLLSAIAHRLANDNIKTTFLHFPSFAMDMKALINSKTDSVGNQVDCVKKVPVLMIDDIGADSMSAWIRDDILGVILEYRMQNQLSTFFSSNFSMEQLEKEHLAITAKGDFEPLKAKRLMERIKFLATPIEVNGKNLRND
ncbi:Primosomal protein DnaI [Fructilactobacillus sanfranciscensis]|uniref:primosomal protein DnaI n=1 Tax=Fructilactobacillus sanfranciscensis TaxID=1625 RepID=UPI0038515C30